MPRSRSLDDLNLAHAAAQLRAQADAVVRQQPNPAQARAMEYVRHPANEVARAATWGETAQLWWQILSTFLPIIAAIIFPACRCRPR